MDKPTLPLLAVTAIAATMAINGCGDSAESSSTTGTSSSSGTSGTGGDGGSDGGGGSGLAGGGGSGGGEPGDEYSVLVGDFAGDPLEGVAVALDTMSGERFEGVTDATGNAAIVVADGAIVVSSIAHKDGFNFQVLGDAYFQGTSIAHSIGLVTPDPMAPGTAAVSGTLSNQVGGTDGYSFVSVSTGDLQLTKTDGYSVRVPVNASFILTAWDSAGLTLNGQAFSRNFNSVEKIANSGVTADATVDIPFSANIAPDTADTVSIPMPTDAGLAADGFAYYNVNSLQTGAFAGGAFSCDANGANFDCTGGTWDIGAGPLETVYSVVEGASFNANNANAPTAGVSVFGVLPGPPQAAPALIYPNPPEINMPAGPGPLPVDAPLAFSVPAGGSQVDLLAVQYWSDEFGQLGVVIMAPDEADFVLPPLPSASDSAAHWTDVAGQSLLACTASGNQCQTYSRRMILASPPAG